MSDFHIIIAIRLSYDLLSPPNVLLSINKPLNDIHSGSHPNRPILFVSFEPVQDALPVSLVPPPLPGIFVAVRPRVLPLALLHAVHELPAICVSVAQLQDPAAVFQVRPELASVHFSIKEGEYPLPTGLVVAVRALIGRPGVVAVVRASSLVHRSAGPVSTSGADQVARVCTLSKLINYYYDLQQ